MMVVWLLGISGVGKSTLRKQIKCTLDKQSVYPDLKN